MAYMRHVTWMVAAALSCWACGDDFDDSDVESRADRGDAGATDEGEATDAEEEATDAESTDAETTDEVADDAGTDEAPAFEPPDPILPDADPETPVEDLSDDEFGQVCDAYLETSSDLIENYAALCAFQAITDAQDSGAEDTEEYRAACAESLAVCETDAESTQIVIDNLECSQEDCTATLGEFDACRAQLTALDAVLLQPLADLDPPSCDEVTPAIGEAFSTQAGIVLFLSLTQLDDGGQSILSGEGPCQSITDQCPDFAVPLGSDLL